MIGKTAPPDRQDFAESEICIIFPKVEALKGNLLACDRGFLKTFAPLKVLYKKVEKNLFLPACNFPLRLKFLRWVILLHFWPLDFGEVIFLLTYFPLRFSEVSYFAPFVSRRFW